MDFDLIRNQGKPGPGGSYWRESALTGQGFYEKMGWSASADPRKRQFEVKRGENDALKREIVDIENKRMMEHKDITSNVSFLFSFFCFLFTFEVRKYK